MPAPPQVAELGRLKLDAGDYELRFQPEKPTEVSLFEVMLKPVH